MSNNKALFDSVSQRCSRLTTRAYSTSFSLGIRFLGSAVQDPIYAIYGFVRLGDEIVDTFHDYPKRELLERFRQDTYLAIEEGISLNPILNSFQDTVRRYGIERELIDSFLRSMEMDLDKSEHTLTSYEEYILGSAEVVGLMCLRVFVDGDQAMYERLKPRAMRLGAAFQKINFLRDLKADAEGLGRMYFPGVDLTVFSEVDKRRIEAEIAEDFHEGYLGILELPKKARFGVYVAYIYYHKLLKKIQRTPPERVQTERIRIPNRRKYLIFVNSYARHRLNLI